MIDVSLGNYSGRAVHTDIYEGFVSLELDLEDVDEVLGSGSHARASDGIAGVLEASRRALEASDAATVRLNRSDLAELVAEIDRLRWRIDNFSASVDVSLYPSEALEVAAALRHHAKEADRA